MAPRQTTTTPRGLERRSALLDAALRIVVRDGPAAVTHRSVADEAGAAHGSIAYYFGGRQDLLREVLARVAADNIAWLEGAQAELLTSADDARGFAAKLAELVGEQLVADREMGFSVLELHLAAGREPELRPLIHGWGAAYVRASAAALERLGSDDPLRDTRLLAQLINGMVLEQLAVPREDFVDAVLTPTLERIAQMIAAA